MSSLFGIRVRVWLSALTILAVGGVVWSAGDSREQHAIVARNDGIQRTESRPSSSALEMEDPRETAEAERAFEGALLRRFADTRPAPESIPANPRKGAPPAREARAPEADPDLSRDLLLLEIDAERLAAHLRLPGTGDTTLPRATGPEQARAQDDALRRAGSSAALGEYLFRRSLANQTFAAGSQPERTLRPRASQRAAEASPALRAVLLARALRELESLPAEPRFDLPHSSRAANATPP